MTSDKFVKCSGLNTNIIIFLPAIIPPPASDAVPRPAPAIIAAFPCFVEMFPDGFILFITWFISDFNPSKRLEFLFDESDDLSPASASSSALAANPVAFEVVPPTAATVAPSPAAAPAIVLVVWLDPPISFVTTFVTLPVVLLLLLLPVDVLAFNFVSSVFKSYWSFGFLASISIAIANFSLFTVPSSLKISNPYKSFNFCLMLGSNLYNFSSWLASSSNLTLSTETFPSLILFISSSVNPSSFNFFTITSFSDPDKFFQASGSRGNCSALSAEPNPPTVDPIIDEIEDKSFNDASPSPNDVSPTSALMSLKSGVMPSTLLRVPV